MNNHRLFNAMTQAITNTIYLDDDPTSLPYAPGPSPYQGAHRRQQGGTSLQQYCHSTAAMSYICAVAMSYMCAVAVPEAHAWADSWLCVCARGVGIHSPSICVLGRLR